MCCRASSFTLVTKLSSEAEHTQVQQVMQGRFTTCAQGTRDSRCLESDWSLKAQERLCGRTEPQLVHAPLAAWRRDPAGPGGPQRPQLTLRAALLGSLPSGKGGREPSQPFPTQNITCGQLLPAQCRPVHLEDCKQERVESWAGPRELSHTNCKGRNMPQSSTASRRSIFQIYF